MKKRIYIILVLISFFSCRKNIDVVVTTSNEFPTEKYVNTSLKGIIVGNRDLPIENALVETGSYKLKTDMNGYFYFKNIKVNRESATIKVSKQGYNTSVKTYYPQLNSTVFVKIKMQSGQRSIIVNTNDGNKNFGSSKAYINIVKNNFVKGDQTFSGDLLVEPFWTVFSDKDFYEKYIAHPVGYDKYFKLRGIKSYGILGLDIKDRNGDKVELGAGNILEIKLIFEENIQLPNDLPEKIPVWYFDFDKGKWIEKSLAIYDYNTRSYNVDVDKAGYWNFGTPYDISSVGFELNSENDNKLPFITAQISSLEYNYKMKLRSTSDGKVFCFLPDNSESVLKFNINNKYIEKKIQNIDTVITLPVKSKTVKLTGDFYDCQDNLIQEGYITILKGNDSLFYYIENGKIDKEIVINDDEEEMLWFATNLNNRVNTGVHISKVDEQIQFYDVYICPEPFAILRYGDDKQVLKMESYDYSAPPILAIVFSNEKYYMELGFFGFTGKGGHYNFNNFSYSIIIDGKSVNRIFPLIDKEQKIKVVEFEESGMMRGVVEGMAKHKNGSEIIDSAYLKIDYSIYTD